MKQTRTTLRLPLSASIAALLVMKTLSANAGTVWDGGGSDNLWNTPANWNDNVAPVPGQTVDLTFGGTVRLTPNNNFAASEDFHSITFGANAGAFTLSGNAVDLFGKIENLSTAPQTIAFDIAVNSGQSGTGEFNPVNGDLFINSANVFTNGNTLHVKGANTKTITFGANTVISQAGSFNIEQASNVVFLGANTYTGATNVLAGSLTIGDGGLTGQLGAGAVTVASGATLTFNRGDAIAPANTFTVGGTLVQNGLGTMTIATSQPGITGAVAINAGRITMGANDSLGTAAITLNGGTLERNAANVTVGNNITVGPSGGTLLGRQVVDNYTAFAGVLSGSGPLTVQGLVTLTNPANTYAGDILVSNASASYLRLVGTNVIGTTSNVTLGGGSANFRLEGTTPSQTIASLNGTAGRIFTVSPGAVLIVGNNNADGTYSGTIDNGTGQLLFQKTGTGTQILSRAAGNGAALAGVVVNGGTLKFNGTGVAFNAGYFTGTTPITVNAGATLEIAGTWNTSSNNIYTLNGGTINFTLAGTEPNANYVNNLNIVDGTVSGNAFRTGNLAAGVTYNISGNLGSTISARMGMVKNGATQTVTLNVNDGTADADLTISGGIHDVTNFAGATLVKNGPGKLVMTGANTYNGPTNVANGILQIGDGGTTGVPGLGEITNSASLVFNRSNSVTIPNTISGAGSLTQAGTGSTMLTGALNYTGPTLVNAGKLFVNTVLSPGSSVTVGGGATLGGSGTVSDGVTVSHNGSIESGDGTSTGTLTLGTLTLGAVAGNLSVFNLAAGSTAAVIVTGNNGLVATGGTGSAKINIGGGIPTLGTHVLIDYAGTLGGGFGAFTLGTLPNRVLATLVNNTSNTSIDINVTGVDFPVWKGAQSSEWSTNTIGPGKNWALNSNNAIGTDYLAGDTVVFNDVATNTTVDVSVADVVPVSVTLNNFAKNYTITGTKAITGVTGLTKSGSGTLTINNTNSFTGTPTINAGTVSVGTVADSGLASPLGAGSNITFGGGTLEFTGTAGITNRSVTLSTGGGTIRTADSLTLNGVISGLDPLTKTGAGTLTLTAINDFSGGVVVSQGTLNSTNNNAFGSGPITLGSPAIGASDVALILSNRVDIPNFITVASDGTGNVVLGADASGTGANAASFLGTVFLNRATTFSSQVPNDRLTFDGQITGSPGTVTVTGGSRTTWRNLANDFTGNVIVTGIGTVLQASVASASEVIPNTANVQVDSDAELWLASTGGQTETIAGLTGTGTVRSYNLSSLGGTRTLAVGFGGATSEFAGTIANGADPVALQKIDSGKLTLSGTNFYTGATSIDGGTLALTGSISGTTSITVQSGANFDVSGVAGGYHLDAGQSLKGDGTVLGAATIDGSLAPGLAIGTLTFNANLALNGNADLEIDKSFGTLTADLVSLANGILTLGGILNVTATGDTLMPGDTFNLFDAPTITGSFAVLNLPLLSNPNYSWDTTKLAVNGTIAVIPEPGTTPALLGGIGLLLGMPRRGRGRASRSRRQ
ncbi:beta strand repeat-containing protein [Verrucomicrobiota bacterium sgz303538]